MTETLQEALKAQGAAKLDPLAWHYIQLLAERAQKQQGPAQKLLFAKLDQALNQLQVKLNKIQQVTVQEKADAAGQGIKKPVLSPLAELLQDMLPEPADPAHKAKLQGSDASSATNALSRSGLKTAWRAESPRIRQFRKQLRQISVQKQVSQALAQAPQNAGPINSHMLVLRSLGLMREASPDYLNRFMAYVDTLLWLDVAESVKPAMGLKTGTGKGAKTVKTIKTVDGVKSTQESSA
jgi:hypothetical protein